jgi:putative transposase
MDWQGRESMLPPTCGAPMTPQHRRRNKSYNEPGHAHELTFSCFRRLPLLSRDRTRQWFIEALDSARRRLNLSLWAYVIMPEHVHVIVWPLQPDYEIRLIRTAMKVPVQRKALTFLRRQAPDFLERLRDEQPNGEVHYRFWQRGGGYDRNITDSATLRTMIEYIHQNPVRRGVVKQDTDWPWSSARYYAKRIDAMLPMDPLIELISE